MASICFSGQTYCGSLKLNNIPKINQADPIPEAARSDIENLLSTGDLFRYTNHNSAVFTLEQNFAMAGDQVQIRAEERLLAQGL